MIKILDRYTVLVEKEADIENKINEIGAVFYDKGFKVRFDGFDFVDGVFWLCEVPSYPCIFEYHPPFDFYGCGDWIPKKENKG